MTVTEIWEYGKMDTVVVDMQVGRDGDIRDVGRCIWKFAEACDSVPPQRSETRAIMGNMTG